jgi:hypothetical protein
MYQHVFRTRISPVKDTQQEFATAAGGYRYTTSVGGTLTGRGGNFIVLDDPMKPQDVYSEVSRKNLTQWHSATSPRKQTSSPWNAFLGMARSSALCCHANVAHTPIVSPSTK